MTFILGVLVGVLLGLSISQLTFVSWDKVKQWWGSDKNLTLKLIVLPGIVGLIVGIIIGYFILCI
jgi:ABC-type antimicrobial peptide transport system permease subunit